MSLDLVPIWTAIIGAAVFLYVLLDGFDLGVGILFAFVSDPAKRNLMINSIAPVWDGNETWLVLGSIGARSTDCPHRSHLIETWRTSATGTA